MESAGNWLEVVDVEDPGIEITIPADHIERMVIQCMAADHVAHLHAHLEITPIGEGFQLHRNADIALCVGRVFQELANVIDISTRRLNF